MTIRKEKSLFAAEDTSMKTPDWLQPGLYGAACGAIALSIIGFSPWGGWVTGGKARQMASEQSQADVVAALSMICVEQSKHDPQLVEKTAALKDASPWTRGELVMKNGWAVMPGSTEASLDVARVCANKIGA